MLPDYILERFSADVHVICQAEALVPL